MRVFVAGLGAQAQAISSALAPNSERGQLPDPEHYDPRKKDGNLGSLPIVSAAFALVPIEETRSLLAMLARFARSATNLHGVSVRGEVSQPSTQRGAIFYLKEEDVVLKCVVWAKEAARLPAFEHGDQVVATGNVVAYTKRSVFQLVVETLAIDGAGSVNARFQTLKRKLDAEGLFAPERKRPLPKYPFRIAIVSSRRAKGGEDFLEILRRRAPHVRVVWCETSVQGPNAPIEIASAIDRASALDVDAIVVTRGGGSFEDLFCFSAEGVVRAIARAGHPVVSAVGHTVDQQLCDFAADRHAETPSAAAESISPETATLLLDLREDVLGVERTIRDRLERERCALDRLETRAVFASPQRLFERHRDRLKQTAREVDDALRARFERSLRRVAVAERRPDAHSPAAELEGRAKRLAVASYRLDAARSKLTARPAERVRDVVARLDRTMPRALARRGERLRLGEARLVGRDPAAILARGYAIVTAGGRIVRDPAAVRTGAVIEARLARGTLRALVAAPEPEAFGAKASRDGDDGIG